MIEPVSDDLTIPIKPRLQCEHADDDLGRIAQRRIEQPAERRPEIFRQRLGRIAHQPGQRNDRQGRDAKQHDRVDTASSRERSRPE